jgi:hypothetical protein
MERDPRRSRLIKVHQIERVVATFDEVTQISPCSNRKNVSFVETLLVWIGDVDRCNVRSSDRTSELRHSDLLCQ